MPRALRPSLYRNIKVVMSDGATFHVPSAVRMVGNTLQLDRDTANHPAYLGLNDASSLMTRREEARLARLQKRETQLLFDD
jgi:ribosomal protein L31